VAKLMHSGIAVMKEENKIYKKVSLVNEKKKKKIHCRIFISNKNLLIICKFETVLPTDII
jgi:hypothetical protein